MLVTRSVQQAVSFVERIGHQAAIQGVQGFGPERFLLAPMLEIVPAHFSCPDFSRYDGLIVTSVHALDMIVTRCGADDPAQMRLLCCMPLYIVGSKTSEKAVLCGLTGPASVAPTAAALMDLLLCRTPARQGGRPGRPRLLYVRGRDVAHDLKNALAELCDIDEITVYEAEAVARVPEEALSALRGGAVEAVTFFSARSAQNFIELVQKNALSYHLETVKALCISVGVLECLRPVWPGCLCAADTPDAGGMAALVLRECGGVP